MHVRLIALLIAISGLYPNTILAFGCPYKQAQKQKVYVQLEAISLTHDGIAVQTDKGIFYTSHLSKDANGYYVLQSNLLPVRK